MLSNHQIATNTATAAGNTSHALLDLDDSITRTTPVDFRSRTLVSVSRPCPEAERRSTISSEVSPGATNLPTGQDCPSA